MHLLISFVAVSLAFATLASGQSQTRRYLYISTPDAAQKDYRSGQGILIFDIDQGHKFVQRRIDIPAFHEGLCGFTGNLETHSAYFSTSNRRVGAFDLETKTIVWDKTYEASVDRSFISLGWREDLRSNRILVLRSGQRRVDKTGQCRSRGTQQPCHLKWTPSMAAW